MIAPSPSSFQLEALPPVFPCSSLRQSADLRSLRRVHLDSFDPDSSFHSLPAQSLNKDAAAAAADLNAFYSYQPSALCDIAHPCSITCTALSESSSNSYVFSHRNSASLQSLSTRLQTDSHSAPFSILVTMATPTSELIHPESPPELSCSASSDESSPSSGNEEEYDSCNFEDISLAGENPPTPTSTSLSLKRSAPRANPSLRYKPSPINTSTRYSPSSRDQFDPMSLPSPKSLSPRGLWHRGYSTPALGVHSSPTSAARHRRMRAFPANSNPFPLAPRSPDSPSRIPPQPFSQRSFENSTLSPSSAAARRDSWQQRPRRKSAKELEDEYHDSDEDLPEDAIVWNIPLTPRPMYSRSQSNSPERKHIGRTSQPQSGTLERRPKRMTPRSKSWIQAMGDLSTEAKALTEALESHADLVRAQSNDSSVRPPFKEPRAKTISLPPVQRSEPLIDPLPPSKEKERFLSRTRPSWLPPKSPKEEKKHLKEWEKMMSEFMEAEKRRSLASSSEPKSSVEESSVEPKA